MSASFAYIYHYSVPFQEPITVKGHKLSQRKGLVLALQSENGEHRAYGEIAPLPGLHKESLEAAERQIVETLAMQGGHKKTLVTEGLFPSVRLGLEMAVLNLEALNSGICPFTPTGAQPLPRVPLNALLFGSPTKVMQRAEEYIERGYRTFKLKLTTELRAEAVESITRLHGKYGNSITLRLDANQSMALDDAIHFANSLPKGSVSYIEEPLQQPRDIGEFHARTGVRSALDETLWQNPALLHTIPNRALGALVLKPNCLGGIAAVLNLARHAAENRLETVFSSAFESGISIGFYARMAAATADSPAPCGLDTYRYLQDNLLDSPVEAPNGELDSDTLYPEAHQVNLKNLTLSSVWTL
ncbi:MAG TPA: o-succinylbenzoate synthase [Chlorobium sp.]|uniref:o-succinylbenzoate synthase n=1 Tax=Chlorobium phaeovibrioides (strain DSM 265 / 1930) TaxID=290318 RepID=A4SD56_CHLPM|nr:o-succinylbenzoate synthase [Chlorobium sp.]